MEETRTSHQNPEPHDPTDAPSSGVSTKQPGTLAQKARRELADAAEQGDELALAELVRRGEITPTDIDAFLAEILADAACLPERLLAKERFRLSVQQAATEVGIESWQPGIEAYLSRVVARDWAKLNIAEHAYFTQRDDGEAREKLLAKRVQAAHVQFIRSVQALAGVRTKRIGKSWYGQPVHLPTPPMPQPQACPEAA